MPQNVTKMQPCPICGKPDMCFSDIRTDGMKVRVCGRIARDMVAGYDGKTYKKLPSKSSSAYSQYVDAMEDLVRSEERRKKWCMEHGYRFVPKEGVDLSAADLAPVEEVWERSQEIAEPLPNAVLDAVLRPWMEEDLVLSDAHKRKLLSEWKVNQAAADEIFATWPIRTLPAEDSWREAAPSYYAARGEGPTRKMLIQALEKRCSDAGLDSPKGIPGVCQDEKTGAWMFASKSGILFPAYDIRGNLYRIRIGTDYPSVSGELGKVPGTFRFWRDAWFFDRDGKPKEEKGILAWKYGARETRVKLNAKGLPPGKPDGKYVNMSSFREWKDYESHLIINRYKNGCQSGSPISIYRPKGAKPGIFWITEGEKKAMVISVILQVTVICVPGVNQLKVLFEKNGGKSIVEILKDEGYRIAVSAYDADKAENAMVAKAEVALVENLFRYFKTGIASWNKAFGKGLDDSLLMGSRPSVDLVNLFPEWKKTRLAEIERLEKKQKEEGRA